jgi:hypothetical protein
MTSLKWVSNTDMLSIGVKPSRFSSFTNASEIHTAFMPKAGSRTSSPGKSGLRSSPNMTGYSPSLSSCARDNTAVYLDLIGLWRNREIVRKFDVRDNKTNLLREFPPHLGDPAYQLIMRNKQFCRELFAKAQLDFRGLHGFLDRLPRFPLLASALAAIALCSSRSLANCLGTACASFSSSSPLKDRRRSPFACQG